MARDQFLNEAEADDGSGWAKHTRYHWARMLNGRHLQYWPSRKKFQYKGKVRRGDVLAFIRRNTNADV